MSEIFLTFVLFFFKVLIIVAAILIIIGGVLAIALKNKEKQKPKLQLTHINKKYQSIREALQEEILTKAELKQITKKEKGNKKSKKESRSKIFLINFHGDIKADATKQLCEEVTAILMIATPHDEVVVTLESGGGVVHGYGFAASQLQRIRDRGIPLKVIVDKIAASGGYMMACVANEIYAAPFAIIGSIGVIAQIPNFHRLLKDKKIDFEQITAGEYKRTLTLFGENTDKDREKMKEDISDIHDLFKDFVSKHRPEMNIQQVATGEYWLGTRAHELRLVDKLITSDDYLLSASEQHDIFLVSQGKSKSLADKISASIEQCVSKVMSNFLSFRA